MTDFLGKSMPKDSEASCRQPPCPPSVPVIAFINRMGDTHSVHLSDLAVEILNWGTCRSITIHAEHLPGLENVRVDWESRHLTDSSDWMLHRDVFQQLESNKGLFSIDLFASRTNTQLPLYYSWRLDPDALAVDTFSITWRGQTPSMPVPTLCTDPQVPKQTEGVTAWLIAESDLVPTASDLLDRPSYPPPPDPRHSLQPRREEPSSGGEGSLTFSHVMRLRRSCYTQRLSERVTEVIRRTRLSRPTPMPGDNGWSEVTLQFVHVGERAWKWRLGLGVLLHYFNIHHLIMQLC